MSLSPAKQKFVDLASEMYGAGETLDKEIEMGNLADT